MHAMTIMGFHDWAFRYDACFDLPIWAEPLFSFSGVLFNRSETASVVFSDP